MTLKKAIAIADAMRPNVVEEERKAAWLTELDEKLEELMSMPVKEPVVLPEELPAEEEALPRPWPSDRELRMPPPYDNIYELYLCAMIDNANQETGLYANDMTLFNAAYAEAIAWWRRTHNKYGEQTPWRTP